MLYFGFEGSSLIKFIKEFRCYSKSIREARGHFKIFGFSVSRGNSVFPVCQGGNHNQKLSEKSLLQVVAEWHGNLSSDLTLSNTTGFFSWDSSPSLCKSSSYLLRESWIQSEDYLFYSVFVSLLPFVRLLLFSRFLLAVI